jgi:superfamily II DNA or RNA helicase
MNDFAELRLEVFYAGTTSVLRDFILPVLGEAESYDRLSAYFSVDSLLSIAQGVENLWRRSGRMRLVIGIHDVPQGLIDAHIQSEAGDQQELLAIQTRLLKEVSSLVDELEKDRIAALAWMMKTGLLEVRVARPKSARATHIFHSKRLIFRDGHDNVISATGSPNETRPGQEGNYEDVTVHTSWGADPRYTAKHVEHFEEIWQDRTPDLIVSELTPDFVDLLLTASQRSHSIPPPLLGATQGAAPLLEAIRAAPHLGHLTYKNAILFPHQERALKDGLNRDAIRLMLADEVGLGKTLEAGALVNHAVRFTGVQSVCILAPASLLRQFQDELWTFFDLEFFIWNSTAKSFVGPGGEVYGTTRFRSPLARGGPRFVIVSSQFARGTKDKGSFLSGGDNLPDMLVVDEAHAARVRPDQDSVNPTRLWRALDSVAGRIKHLVLMTATPLQVHPLEFHGLLQLLGLTDEWNNRKSYLRSLEFLAGQVESPSLQDASLMARLLSEALVSGGGQESELDSGDVAFLNQVSRALGSDSVKGAILTKQRWAAALKLLAELHPAHRLVVRNTRRGLERLGYKFPERQFEAPDLVLGKELMQFFSKLEDYLDRNYGDVEEAANPTFAHSRGFAKSGYQQRLASSLFAASESLNRRLLKIETLVNGNPVSKIDEELLLDADDDETEALLTGDSNPSVNPQVALAMQAAAIIEQGHIRGLLNHLNAIPEGILGGDPKFVAAGYSIASNIQTDKILVFSRFTDTLDGFIRYMGENFGSVLNHGFALYTGAAAWIQVDGTRFESSKEGIRRSLDRGQIRLVICSDAASEGLNLQAARSLINLDVPWNPARLEQRIGRIARLGQAADTVAITNLWYPDSIEAKMYRRLLERKELYELAVGEFPDIFGSAIKNHARVQGLTSFTDVDVQAISELEDAREQVQSRALARVWDISRQVQSDSDNILGELAAFLQTVNLAGRMDVPATFGNIPLDRIPIAESIESASASTSVPLFKVAVDRLTWGFVVRGSDGWKLIKDSSLCKVLMSVLGYSTLNAGDCLFSEEDESSFLNRLENELPDSFPGPRALESRFPRLLGLGTWSSRATGGFVLERIGSVNWSA